MTTHFKQYHGKATSVVLYGAQGTAFTLHNDQHYKKDTENYVTIVKRTNAPTTVDLTQNRMHGTKSIKRPKDNAQNTRISSQRKNQTIR